MPFPFSYFGQMLAPRRIFASRKSYKWWQIAIILVFLNSLILMPVSLHYAGMKTYDMERIVSKGLAAITDDTYQALQFGKITDGQFQGQKQIRESKAAIIAVLPTKAEQKEIASSGKAALVLTKNKWLFTYPNGEGLEAFVSGEKDLSQLGSLEKVRAFVNDQWYKTHKSSVFLFLIVVYTALLYVGSLLLLLVGAGTLYLTRKAAIFDLKSLKECAGLLLNCMGVPSLLALVAAMLGLVENPVLLMNIQIFGTILMMMLVLYRTGFKDAATSQLKK